MKDFNIENNVTHLERQKGDEATVDKTIRKVELGDVFKQRRQPEVCQEKGKEHEDVQPAMSSEKLSKVVKADGIHQPEIMKEGKEKAPAKLPEVSKRTMRTDQHLTLSENGAEVLKAEEEHFKVPLRSKGKVSAENGSLWHANKPDTHLQSNADGSEEPEKLIHHRTPESTEIQREKEPAAKQSVKRKENNLEQEAKFAPPRPPARVKSKSKGGVERQCSRDTETDQDDQHVSRDGLKTRESQTTEPLTLRIKTDVKEKNKTGEEPLAIDAAPAGHPIKASAINTSTRQLVKQPVKPMKKEMEQEMKVVVEPMRRREREVETRQTEDVPLLYISEDEAFSEALSEMPVVPLEVWPTAPLTAGVTRPADLPSTNVPKEDQHEVDITTEDEPQLQEAAVKIQAAFKGYKTRRDMRPIFRDVFKNQSMELHDTATLVCNLEGKPMTVRWLRNGQPITTDHRCEVKAADGGICSLVIKNLASSDSGVYTCEAANKFGVTSYNGNLTVVHTQKPAEKAAHPPLAAITPLQLATRDQSPNVRQNQDQSPTVEPTSYVESVSVSLWEAYNLTEQHEAPIVSLQDRRGSSPVASSSK